MFNLDAEPEVRAPKIVQICCDRYRLYALTDTGEIWVRNEHPDWHRLPPLPAEDDEREAA